MTVNFEIYQRGNEKTFILNHSYVAGVFVQQQPLNQCSLFQTKIWDFSRDFPYFNSDLSEKSIAHFRLPKFALYHGPKLTRIA